MHRNILIMGLALCAGGVYADGIEAHLHALHYDTTRQIWGAPGYYDHTPGVGYSTKTWAVGVFDNSFRKPAAYVLWRRGVSPWWGYEIGAATGYRVLYGLAIQPIATVYVQTGLVRVRIVPGQVVAVGISIRYALP